MLQHLVKGCKPRSAWRIGTEHEKLGFVEAEGFRRPSYDKIRAILRGLESKYGWQPIMEGDNIIGVKTKGKVGCSDRCVFVTRRC